MAFHRRLKSNHVLLNGRIPQPVREWAYQKEDQLSCIVTVGGASYHVHHAALPAEILYRILAG
ncbi:hypothetical protein ACW9JV_02385 [Salibacterium sp. K-3]